jgi:hypothetical protein
MPRTTHLLPFLWLACSIAAFAGCSGDGASEGATTASSAALVFYPIDHDTTWAPASTASPDLADPSAGIEAPDATASGHAKTLLAFAGISRSDNALPTSPPDPNASVGATQIVEVVNEAYEVFDKETGRSLSGVQPIGALWKGFPGTTACNPNQSQASIFFDPVVIYDKPAARWILSAIATFSGNSLKTQCIAVSATSDATGAYARYAFFEENLDFTKIAVWPTSFPHAPSGAYLLSFEHGPAHHCALDRRAILSGAPVPAFACPPNLPSEPKGTVLLPSDADGPTPPPEREPGFYVQLDAGGAALDLYQLVPDFTNPSNSTFQGPFRVAVPAFTRASTPAPQRGTATALDPVGDRPMHRFAYRNFGSHESLVVNHTVAVGGRTGVRWYEIRHPSSPAPTLFQSGTVAPDSKSRWMGSVAMDSAGDIALGYSVSSASTFPSIAVAGRVPTDPRGHMETEVALLKGTGADTDSPGVARWGDYASMAIDPSDDKTFWYTSEYYAQTGSNWNTRIASFRMAP